MPQDMTFLIGVFVIFIALTVVPNMIQRRRHEQELASVHRGDWVVTDGGIIGQVQLIGPQEAVLRISATSELTIMRQAIRGRIAARPAFAPQAPTEEAAPEDENA